MCPVIEKMRENHEVYKTELVAMYTAGNTWQKIYLIKLCEKRPEQCSQM
jgi:hypothetical protein